MDQNDGARVCGYSCLIAAFGSITTKQKKLNFSGRVELIIILSWWSSANFKKAIKSTLPLYKIVIQASE
jgi:hypothetical protein